MAEPRYSPRTFSVEPDGFGKIMGIQWRKPSNGREAALTQAARLQHRYAIRIRYRAKARDSELAAEAKAKSEPKPTETSLRSLARQMGCSYIRLQRALRGQEVLRLDDIAWADIVLGEISEIAQPPRKPPESR